MSYLNKMYGQNSNNLQPQHNKNPNRVTGGLKAQGVDKFTMVAEDGSNQEIPTLAYVRSLEEQVKKQRAALDVLERKLARQDTSIQQLSNAIVKRF
jgi:hypothetical protein